MALNAIIPICMILELVLICIKNSSRSWEKYPVGTLIGAADIMFTLVIPVYLFSSVLWLLYFKSHYNFITKIRMIRMYQGGVLSLVGAAMLWTAFDVGSFRKNCDTKSKECEGYELRTTAGVLTIIDACLYCFRPTKMERNPGRGTPTSPIDDSNVYVISNELPEYEEPPSYFDLQLDQSKVEPTVHQLPPPALVQVNIQQQTNDK